MLVGFHGYSFPPCHIKKTQSPNTASKVLWLMQSFCPPLPLRSLNFSLVRGCLGDVSALVPRGPSSWNLTSCGHTLGNVLSLTVVWFAGFIAGWGCCILPWLLLSTFRSCESKSSGKGFAVSFSLSPPVPVFRVLVSSATVLSLQVLRGNQRQYQHPVSFRCCLQLPLSITRREVFKPDYGLLDRELVMTFGQRASYPVV